MHHVGGRAMSIPVRDAFFKRCLGGSVLTLVDVWLRLVGWWLGQALVHPVSRAWRSFSPALLHFVSLPFLAGFCCLGFGFLPGWPGWPSWPAWPPGPLGPIPRLARLLRLTRLALFARLVWLAWLARVTRGYLWKKTPGRTSPCH